MQTFFGKANEPTQDTAMVRKKAEINIFTVASGLLYEVSTLLEDLVALQNDVLTSPSAYGNDHDPFSFKTHRKHR